MPLRKLRVVIADDHRRVRQGLRALLESEPDFEIVAEADDGLRALAAARQHRPDVLLLDHEMPGMRGLEVARTVQREVPGVRPVLFTLDDTARGAAAASGVPFIAKDVAHDHIATRLRDLAYGGATASRGPVSAKPEAEPIPELPGPARDVRRRPWWPSLIPFPTYAAYAVFVYVVIQQILGSVSVRIDELAVSVAAAEVLAAYSFWRHRRNERRAIAARRQKVRELDVIARAAALYSGPFALQEVVARFLDQMRASVGPTATATLIVYDDGARTFEPVREIGPNAGAFKRNVYPIVVLPHEIFQRVVVEQRTWALADTEPARQAWRELTNFFPRLRPSTRTIAVIPLRSRGDPVGVVVVRDAVPGTIDAERLELLETLAHFIAGALHATYLAAAKSNGAHATREPSGATEALTPQYRG